MTRRERIERIRAALRPLQGSEIWCPALNSNVRVTRDSVDEIVFHASKDDLSTMAAVRLPYHLKTAKLVGVHLPKDNKQKKRFHFVCVFELNSEGKVKIIVGRNEAHITLQYCITHMRGK